MDTNDPPSSNNTSPSLPEQPTLNTHPASQIPEKPVVWDESNTKIPAIPGRRRREKTSQEIEAEKRRKAEKKAARQAKARAEAEKPIDPKIWLILGAVLLFIAACIFFDPVSFASAGQSQTDGMWIRDILVIIVGVFGKNPTALILAVLSLLSLGWGIRGWLQPRTETPAPEQSEETA